MASSSSLSSSRLLSSRPELGSRHRRGDDATVLAAVEGKEKNRRRLQNGRHDTHRVLADFNVQRTRGGALFFVAALFLVAVFAVIFHGGDSTIAESEVANKTRTVGEGPKDVYWRNLRPEVRKYLFWRAKCPLPVYLSPFFLCSRARDT